MDKGDGMGKMKNILEKSAEDIAYKRAKWIDSAIRQLVPIWKLKLLQKFHYQWLKKLIKADIQVIDETLIAEFGTRTIVRVNDKYVAMKFNIEIK